MDQAEEDAGTIAALMLRMVQYRLPRAQRMLERVKKGKLLSQGDIQFLKRVYKDNRANQALFKRNPDYMELIAEFIDLYAEIITLGLENEKVRAG